VHATDPRVHYKRRVIEAALGFLIGVALLLAGVVINVTLIAVAGFMVTRQRAGATAPAPHQPAT